MAGLAAGMVSWPRHTFDEAARILPLVPDALRSHFCGALSSPGRGIIGRIRRRSREKSPVALDLGPRNPVNPAQRLPEAPPSPWRGSWAGLHRDYQGAPELTGWLLGKQTGLIGQRQAKDARAGEAGERYAREQGSREKRAGAAPQERWPLRPPNGGARPARTHALCPGGWVGVGGGS